MTEPPRPDLALFCEEQHGRVLAMLTVYLDDRQVAEELTQDALVRACRDWHRVRLMSNPNGWISTVAFNLARSWFRRQYAARRARARQEAANSVQPATRDQATALTVRAAVASLPRRQREAVILRFLDDRSVAETATIMGCSTGTVKTHTSRALSSLRDLDLGLQLPDGPEAATTAAEDGEMSSRLPPDATRPGRPT